MEYNNNAAGGRAGDEALGDDRRNSRMQDVQRVQQMGRRRRPAKWQIAALATAGGIGALALANRITEATAGDPYSVLEGEHGRYAWTRGGISYTVRGRGEPLVLIHGVYAGASSFEFRRVFAQLAEHHRVYAFDLLGFGLSDRPRLTYTPDLYVALIQDFVRQVVGGMDHPVQVVASSLGAAFTIRAAAERPDLFERLALIEPTGIQDLASDPESNAHIVWRSILRSPLVGQTMYNAITSRAGIRFFLRTTYDSRDEVSDDLVDYYYTQAHQPNARFAPASFIAGALDTPVDEEYMRLTMPILLLWGKNARFTPLEHARAFRQLNPRTDLRVFECGALPQDELPDEFARVVENWLRSPIRPQLS
jgi:pimeloyl-ACP methyl ester carboxylesterase